jgi:hypothetical protein
MHRHFNQPGYAATTKAAFDSTPSLLPTVFIVQVFSEG